MSVNKLTLLIDELAAKIPDWQKVNSNVSKASAGWQMEHTLLVVIKIITQLQNAAPVNYKWKFSISKQIVFFTGKIPRGRAKAPKAVLPAATQSKQQLEAYILEAKQKIALLNNLNTDNYFEHPFFGNLKVKETIKFLQIHTSHHLKIINDIIK